MRTALTAILIGVSLLVATPLRAQSCTIADLSGDTQVNAADLALLLGAWGECAGACPADLTGDGAVNAADLALLLGAWGEPVATGSFPGAWISGGPNCGIDPTIQIHQYNANTYVLRQSLCTNFEGPFVYLLFGEDKVLQQDTGASGGQAALANAVYDVIDDWLAANEKASIDLIVTHSHAHGDHVAGDSQYLGQPNTTVVANSLAAIQAFFGITPGGWPTQIVEYDLGDRVIDVIPIPGHESRHIALYDRETNILFTGDTLYPGRLYFSAQAANFQTYKDSVARLVTFTDSNPVCWVLGTHIEMTNTAGVDFSFGATHHPNEHELQLTLDHLLELHQALQRMPVPHIEVHDDFIIYPLGLPARP